MAVRLALMLAVARSSAAKGFVDECGTKTTCEECLMEGTHNFCGWCSPGPVIYASGKPGARCADERDEPWDCPQHYATKACPAQYTCNTTAGTCSHAKLGDPKATNQSTCAASCHKKVPPQNHNQTNTTTTKYTCQNQTGTCVPAHSAGGVPSSNGTDLATCNTTCHKKPKALPLELNGLWRGVMISKGFQKGEYDFLFDSSKNTVALTGPGMSNVTADVTTGMTETTPPQITLAFNAGMLAGKFRKAIYMIGPAGPETNTTIIALGPPFPSADTASAPATFADAMAGETNQVFFLRACLSDPGLQCNWAGAPPPSKTAAIRKLKVGQAVTGLTDIEAVITLDQLAVGVTGVHSRRKLEGVSAAEDHVRILNTLQAGTDEDHAHRAHRLDPPPGPPPTGDPCNVHTNCSTCTAADAGHQCGWCTAPVTYGNGSLLRSNDPPGAVHCAGFSAAGVAQPWECDGLYVRGPCYDHICEVNANYTVNCRHTIPGEVGTMSAAQCPLKCKPPAKVYACNHTVGQCQVVPPGHAGGEAQSVCQKNCTKPPPPPPPPPPGFVCNNATLTCESVNGSNCSTAHNAPANAPKCQTADACHLVCQPVYQCQISGNGTNYTCVEVKLGTPGAQNHSQCSSTCVEPPKHNCTPPVLQGKYRGISIGGSGMPHAEWDLRLGQCDAELRNTNGTVWTASVYTGGASPISFRLDTGGELHGLYTFENGPDQQTVRFTLALGKLNGPSPKDWMTAMAPGSNMSVYGLVKCADDKPAQPVPGGIYCDPHSTPPEMCPPLNPGDKPTPCECASPNGPGGTCLCPGHYPPPPPPPPGAGNCNFSSVFDGDGLRSAGNVQH